MHANVYEKKTNYLVVFDRERDNEADFCVYIPFYREASLELAKNIIRYVNSSHYEWCGTLMDVADVDIETKPVVYLSTDD